MLAHAPAGNPLQRTLRDLYLDTLEILRSSAFDGDRMIHRLPIFLLQRFTIPSHCVGQDYTIRFHRLDKA